MAYYPRIKSLRKENSSCKKEIAKYLGTKKKYYNSYEKGMVELSFVRAIALAKYYNVSLDYIAGLTNDKRGLARSDLSREQRELLRTAKELRTADKDKTIALLKAMINAIK